MRKIETEHGAVYITEEGEDDSSYDQLKTQGSETKKLGEDLWLDPNAYRISGPLCALITVVAVSIGFGIGSYFHDSSSTRITLIISFTVLLMCIGRARTVWMQYESAYMEMLEEHRAEEHVLLDKRLKVEMQVEKQLDSAVKLQGKEDKRTARTYDFTSDDFDSSATMLLSKPVKQARKSHAKVTGQGLLETILKGIR